MTTATTTRYPAGTIVLVEVLGLPGRSHTDPPAFPYRAAEDLTRGQQVQVPAPDWAIRVTGRGDLPGFVLGAADDDTVASVDHAHLRSTIPTPAVPADDSQSIVKIRRLVARWREEARALHAAGDQIATAADSLEASLD